MNIEKDSNDNDKENDNENLSINRASWKSRIFSWFRDEFKQSLNFYRIHLLIFTICPLVIGSILYGANEDGDHKFIDTLFVATSAFTVTGLSTIELSYFTGFQQAVVFFCMCIGSTSTVSIVMVIIRRFYFRKRFENVILNERAKNSQRRRSFYDFATTSARETASGIRSKLRSQSSRNNQSVRNNKDNDNNRFDLNSQNGGDNDNSEEFKTPIKPAGGTKLSKMARNLGISKLAHTKTFSTNSINSKSDVEKKKKKRRFTPSMIRRVDAPALINKMAPGGWISDKTSAKSISPPQSPKLKSDDDDDQNINDDKDDIYNADNEQALDTNSESESENNDSRTPTKGKIKSSGSFNYNRNRKFSNVTLQTGNKFNSNKRGESFSSRSDRQSQPKSQVQQPQPIMIDNENDEKFPRSATIGFREPDVPMSRQRTTGTQLDRTNTHQSGRSRQLSIAPTNYFPRTTTKPYSTKDRDFGGFPGPINIIARLINKFAPRFRKKLDRSMTMPYTHTYTSAPGGTIGEVGSSGKPAPYISFDAIVGRNSVFKDLSDDQLEELGGAEYRALKILTLILICYYFLFQLIGLTIIAPYINLIPRFKSVVVDQVNHLNPVWFTAFNTVSAYSNTGMSLVDTSLQNFQDAYGMYLPIAILILIGNTCFPIMLRFIIYLLSKIVRKNSNAYQGLHFLLDHPRRAFLYLFPSHQTWFLLSIVIIMVVTDWICFLLLDIGTPSIEEIPLGRRFACGFLQSTAVRAAGFNIVNLSNLSPSVQILYLVMMFVSVYPIALSVRGTNVYEEMSLGVFNTNDENTEDIENDQNLQQAGGSRSKVWGSYFGWHVKKQLAFDIWWLAFALFLLCIIERGKILDDEKQYFTIFSILFELVSAYGTVGLSLGVSDHNFSLSGEMRTLSKLLLCVVMIRGRHRGLPSAIDRAVSVITI